MKENKWLYKGEFKEMEGIFLESRGGAKSSKTQRNPNYKLLLQYALETLKNAKLKDVEIYIASKSEAKYPNLSDRLLVIDDESKIDFSKINIPDFIKKLSKEIRLSGQTGIEKGGNSTKSLFFNLKENAASVFSITSSDVSEDETKLSIKEKLSETLNSFEFDFKRPATGKIKELRALVTDLQNNLKNYLDKEIVDFEWQTEYKSYDNTSRKDSFDIYGYNKEEDVHIVIELDPHRADSIAKKFVSRLALMKNKNLLYVAYLYPGTDSMSKSEANKYLLDCETIFDVLNVNTNVEKHFIGYYL